MSLKDKIYITEFDLKRLKGLIKHAKESWDERLIRHLDDLDDELERAEIVRPEEIPADVITMNSTFMPLISRRAKRSFTLWYSLEMPIPATARSRCLLQSARPSWVTG